MHLKYLRPQQPSEKGVLANHDGDGDECQQTEGLMSKTMILHVRFES